MWSSRPFSTGIQVGREDFEALQQDSIAFPPTTGLKIKSSAEPQLAFGESALSLRLAF
jgi:hypothetical protein